MGRKPAQAAAPYAAATLKARWLTDSFRRACREKFARLQGAEKADLATSSYLEVR
jgi:hypothetical protein